MKENTTETFLTIATRPDKGGFYISDFQLQYGFAGAVLLEMSVDETIDTDNGKLVLKKSTVRTKGITSQVATQIRDSGKPRKIRYWVNKVARRSRRYRKQVLLEMERKGLVRMENKKFLGLIPYQKHFLHSTKHRSQLIQEMRNVVLNKAQATEPILVQLGLIEACKMYKVLSTNKDELKIIRKQLKEIIKESPIAGTIGKTIQEVQAAILITVIVSSVASSSGAN